MLVQRYLLLFFSPFLSKSFSSYLLCHSLTLLSLLPRYRSLLLFFHSLCVRVSLKSSSLSLPSFVFVSFLVSPSLCHFLFFTIGLSIHPLMHSIHHLDLLSDLLMHFGGKVQHQTKSRLHLFLQMWRWRERENKSRSTFKGLLVLAPKERKGYPSNFKGLVFCPEKWTMAGGLQDYLHVAPPWWHIGGLNPAHSHIKCFLNLPNDGLHVTGIFFPVINLHLNTFLEL